MNTKDVADGIRSVVKKETFFYEALAEDILSVFRNGQGRTVKEIVGHMIDSASNNHQRIVRLQYNDELVFPDYGQDNDRWIRIQHYNDASWGELVALWRFYNLHMARIIEVSDASKADNTWKDRKGDVITLAEMVESYLRHLVLHVEQIREMIESNNN